MITIKKLSKSFSGKRILNQIDLEVSQGQRVALIGASGCGKSTLLKILLGLEYADSGEIEMMGCNLQTATQSQFMEMLGRVSMSFQSNALFDSLTVGENVGFMLQEKKILTPTQIRRKVLEKLEMVGLPGTENRMPSQLSGGQRKRVSFARAICNDPQIVFFDEPTTGLDPITSTTIEDLIVKLSDELKVTALVVTHQISTILRASQQIKMIHEGQLIDAGTPATIEQHANPIVRNFIRGGL
jgi:phospholipid/cholesterol/gamma-HCH transport system ATP-binding protein